MVLLIRFTAFDYSRNALYLILLIIGLCAFSVAGALCVLDLSRVSAHRAGMPLLRCTV